jgi:hypothetical protein
MKNIAIICLLILTACKTVQPEKTAFKVQEPVFYQTENCPENGTCTIEFIPNKSIDFKTDEFGNLYPVIANGVNTVFKYTFTKNTVSDSEDSNYTEIIYAELKPDFSTINLIDNQLQTVKLHYGRLCFCKGESGYFAVNNGVFNISKNTDDTVKIDVNFFVKKIPQIISEIHETVSLKSNATN